MIFSATSSLRRVRSFAVLGLAVGCLCCAANLNSTFADDKAPAKAPEGMPQMSAEDMKMMEKMAANAKVGKEHEGFKAMEGTFDAASKMWMKPNTEPMASTGKMVNTLLMGGRYLKGEFSGDMMGEKFTGMSMLAYDNATKKYVNTWCDSMSTGIMTSTGTSTDSKSISLSGECMDCSTDKMTTFRQTVEVVSNDKHIMKMYGPGPDGKEYMMMEITYTRAK